MSDIEAMIYKWLLDENFTVRKIDRPQDFRAKWGLNANTPGAPGIAFSIINPLDKPDRYVMTMGIVISPEHRRELDKHKPQERLRIMNNILFHALSICPECKIVVQPNLLNPEFITVNLDFFAEEFQSDKRFSFMKSLYKFLNTYIAIVAGFNEWLPVIPEQGGKSLQGYTI